MQSGHQPGAPNGAGQSMAMTSSPENRPVGYMLQEIRSRLLALSAHLEQHLDAHAIPLVGEARRVLSEQSCRIAVIGQIKAGKSTFLNAFAGQPGLLPTDVNPWTAVVTKLHFRTDTPPPKHAAVFHLFSPDEWQRLAEGGGRVRELTERLVPGFEPELLRAQLELMRQRAQARLGNDLSRLLGQVHSYERITTELLDDYVTAGTYAGTANSVSTRPHYSDITSSAELFFDKGPFAFPVTLIDTPGVNDPFLVRDEITRRSLENSDIYIFVISALQPLSQTDISLLRILAGLHKDRIIVFVNRADQLRNPASDAVQVRRAVEERLSRDFPSLRIPVIVGSAWWGGLGQIAGQRDVARMLPKGSIAYLQAHGLPAHLDLAPGKALTDAERLALQSALAASSGIPATAAAVTDMLSGGSAAVLLHQLNACFHELAKASEVSARMELQSVLGLLESRRAEAEFTGERLIKERESLDLLDGPIRQIQDSFQLIERQLSQIVSSGLATLRKDLFDLIQSFASSEASIMTGAIQRRSHGSLWDIDLRPLRDAMEGRYYEGYQAIEHQVMDIERILYPQLRNIIATILPEYGISIGEEYAGRPEQVPSIASLNETLVLDLDIPWWKAWFARKPDPRQRAEDLIGIIQEDFHPIAEEMLNAISKQMTARAQRTLQQAEAVSTGMLTTVQERKGRVIAEYESFMGDMQGARFDEFQAEQVQTAERCNQRMEACRRLAEQLRQLQLASNQAFGLESNK